MVTHQVRDNKRHLMVEGDSSAGSKRHAVIPADTKKTCIYNIGTDYNTVDTE